MKGKKERGSISQLLDYAGERRPFAYLGCALSAISMLLGMGPYICIWFVAKELLAVAPQWEMAAGCTQYGWLALLFSAASLIVYLIALLCTHLAAFKTASNMRRRSAEHLLEVPLGYFESHASGALRRTIDGCAGETETLLAHNLPDAAGSITLILGMFVTFAIFDWRLGLACFVSIVISLIGISMMMGGTGAAFMQRYEDSLVAMNKTGTEYVRGIPVLKVFQQTVFSFRVFHESINAYSEIAREYAVDYCRVPQSVAVTAINGVVIFLIPTVLFLAPDEQDLGLFLANLTFYAVFSAIIPTSMLRLMFLGKMTQMAGVSLERVSAVVHAPVLSQAAHTETMQDNGIVFDHVSYTYEGATNPALSDLSFEIEPASTVALVGPSGGGKTTCASLVPRFWDPDEGRVLVGGADVRNLDQSQLMDSVAFVFQGNRLFRTSLLENVRAAKPGATREEVVQALSAARCEDIVAKLPDGLDTPLGAGGAHLSGGEIQRVLLARAILKDAPIVVLDEATAFADPENELLIQEAMSKLAAGRTVLMIAHRLSTVVRADKIIVIDQGRVRESGSHHELLAQDGLYARMWADYERAATWRIARSSKQATTQPVQPAGGVA
ncbi:ABC transporter ATP-binding protein/permease [Collinsella sp. AGMB00827]|uniref:ABC transporter ATP-binding protein/permease n=1 Tax=Collinsella ureilytica TaxID=2869515 RepID=A0ABS7MM88_9ACTN|nr:ABC transporter ATP-binding protein [Collinsella urealyticum]MBY4798173.1 ABC transporter ATP-binding protein/permease [Collinsella urealyticum]